MPFEKLNEDGLRRDNYRSTSLERGLAILASFSREHPVLGISDLGERLGMNRSTVHRYVTTLAELGYVEQDPGTRKYRLGVKVVDLGFAAINSRDLREVARPHLEDLVRRTGQTCSLSILDGIEIVYLERVLSEHGLNLDFYVGSRLPAYCTSMGKVLLAGLNPEQLDDALSRMVLLQRGPNTITDRSALREELRRVREQGYAVNNEEQAYGLRSVAAPIHNERGRVVAAVNLAVHASTIALEVLIESQVPQLVATADQISAYRGYRRAAS